MYKYIKGHEVISSEHMLSATEIAEMYSLYTLNNKPNAKLVTVIIRDYFKDDEDIYEYYYPHSHGVMRVYPYRIYSVALMRLALHLLGEQQQEHEYVSSDGKKIKFKYKKGDR